MIATKSKTKFLHFWKLFLVSTFFNENDAFVRSR